MKCGNRIVRLGDSISQVVILCGAPLSKNYIGQVKKGNKYVNVDVYTYVLRKGSFARILEFNDGTLAKIEHGPRM